MRYLSAHYVFPVSSPPLKNGILCINDDGRIDDIIDTGGELREREKLEFYNGILVPGFVNAHCHLELSHLYGAIEPHKGLPGFISSVGNVRQANSAVILAAAKAADEGMARNGIVAVGDISNSTDTLSVKRNSLLTYYTFVEVFGLDGNRSEEIIEHAKYIEQKFHDAGLHASVAPHATYSVSPKLWEALQELYAAFPPNVVSIHHQESDEETNLFMQGRGGLADVFRKNGFMADGYVFPKDILHRIHRCLRYPTNCLFVHNTFSDEKDLLRCVTNTPKCFFVLCPGSNLYIQGRLPDLSLFASPDYFMKTCLGTDSLASNIGLSILEEMKIIRQHAPAIPFATLLQWATLNGAMALGIEGFAGSFEKNKKPGVNLLTNIDFDRMQLTANSAVEVLVEGRNMNNSR